TQAADKFAGIDFTEGPAQMPILKGIIQKLVCRKVAQYDGGDHVILIGEVEEYKNSGGEPLVFHSGRYRITTHHPVIVELSSSEPLTITQRRWDRGSPCDGGSMHMARGLVMCSSV